MGLVEFVEILKEKRKEITDKGINLYAPEPYYSNQKEEMKRKLQTIDNILEVLE